MKYCGGKGSIIPIPQFMFSASCKRHDEGYDEGGDEIRRFECDYKFYQAMLKDAGERKIYRFWAWIYYKAVRLCGSKYFNYK